MANANSTPVVKLAAATSFLKNKFGETNSAICQASLIAHFVASTVSKHVESSESMCLDGCSTEGLLLVLNNLVERMESALSLLDECEAAVLKAEAS